MENLNLLNMLTSSKLELALITSEKVGPVAWQLPVVHLFIWILYS